MDFQQVVHKRRMVRAFREDPLAPAVVERILANGNRAPRPASPRAMGSWCWRRLRSGPASADGRRCRPPAGPEEMAAPLVIVPLACKAAYLERYAEPDKGWTDRDEGRWPIPYWYIDTGFAALLMLLTAVDEDLGALFFGLAPEEITALRAAFGVPDDHEPIGVIAIGHPAPGGSTGSAWRGRRPLDQVVHRGHW